MPPITAMITKLPDWPQNRARGSTKLLSSAYSVPATLAKKQEITKEIQRCQSTGMPRNCARRSFSRIATSVRPKGERSRSAIAPAQSANTTSTR